MSKAIAAVGFGAILAVGAVLAGNASASTEDPWDKGIPEDVKADVKRLLANETNPANLRAYASQLRQTGYPKAAALLDRQAAKLEAQAAKPLPAGAAPDLGPMPEGLRNQLTSYLGTERDPALLRHVASSLNYMGFEPAGVAFEARAAKLEQAAGRPLGKTPPSPARWDDNTTAEQRAAWDTALHQTMIPWSNEALIATHANYPKAAQTFGARSMVLKASQPPEVSPGSTPAPVSLPAIPGVPGATVPASWTIPGLPAVPAVPGVELPPVPGVPAVPGFPGIPAIPGVTTPATQPPAGTPPGPVPGVPPFVPPTGLPGLPPGFTPPAGLPAIPGAVPGLPPGLTPPAGIPAIPGVTTPGTPGTPAPAGKVAPSVYGLKPGVWINDARQIAYVVQPGDYGAVIASKVVGVPLAQAAAYVPSLVKENPQVKDWTKVAPGTDLAIPSGWRQVKATEGPTLRPGPPSPGSSSPATTPAAAPPPSGQPWIGPVPPGVPVPPGFAIPGVTAPASTAKVDPSVYGLKPGVWINDARQVAYVVQPGDYGAKIAAKVTGKKEGEAAAYVASLVKANPGKNWQKMAAGTDLVIPDGWRQVAANEGPTLRPGPPSPSADLSKPRPPQAAAPKPPTQALDHP